MRKPTNFDYKMVLSWLDNHRAFWAWERMYELVSDDPPRAWRMIQVMVAYAPDRGTLGYVAAGPVEDMMGGDFLMRMREEAEINPRLRIALGMTNGLPKELEPFAEQGAEGEKLPPILPIAVTPEEVELMTAYFHQRDISWTDSFFGDLNRYNPTEALFMLQMLLDKAKNIPDLLEDVFVHAVNPFVHTNFTAYRPELTALAMHNEALRQWFTTKYRWPPRGKSNKFS